MAKNSILCAATLPDYENQDRHSRNNVHESQVMYVFKSRDFPPLFPEDTDTTNNNSCINSHRQAEKRRRDRINAQLARLRKLIPKSEKMDKAALLQKVVEQVKDLKRKATEISKSCTIPTETDDITIEFHTNNRQESQSCNVELDNNMLIKATFCCEDRPDLISELTQALKGLNLTLCEAEMTCLGGRMKSILILYKEDIIHKDNEVNCNVSAIKKALMGVLNRIVSWSTSSSNFRVISKRQRFFFSR